METQTNITKQQCHQFQQYHHRWCSAWKVCVLSLSEKGPQDAAEIWNWSDGNHRIRNGPRPERPVVGCPNVLDALHPDAIFVELAESCIPLLEGKEVAVMTPPSSN
jgi:hypothetical protein